MFKGIFRLRNNQIQAELCQGSYSATTSNNSFAFTFLFLDRVANPLRSREPIVSLELADLTPPLTENTAMRVGRYSSATHRILIAPLALLIFCCHVRAQSTA